MTSPTPRSAALSAIGGVHAIALEGDDARRFAQAQFSGDVDALAAGRWQWNAWLTAQGRVQALMHLIDPGDGRLLALLRGGDAASILEALGRFRLRMRVTLDVRRFVGVAEGPRQSGTCNVEPDATLAIGYGERSLRLLPDAMPVDVAARAAWRLADIKQGWPNLPEQESGFLPPALGLEHLGAVSFGKGCYPGQEIAARLHYRGGHKQRLCHVRCRTDLARGALCDAHGIVIARILDSVSSPAGTDALVVVQEARSINDLHDDCTVISRFDA